MIHCKKCKTVNPETAVVCQKCGRDLLTQFKPPNNLLVNLLGGLFLSAVAFLIVGGINWWIAGEIQWICPSISAVGLMGIVLIIANAEKEIAKYQSNSYFARALYHRSLDPQQAISDYKKVLETQPELVTEPMAREGIYSKLAELYAELDQQEELAEAVEIVVDALNERIEKMKTAAAITVIIKTREEFCEKYHVTPKLSGRSNFGTCVSCGRQLEGNVFHFHYGKQAGSSVTPIIIPGVMLGGSTSKSYQIAGQESGFLCLLCCPDSDAEAGSAKLIEAMRPRLASRGYDAFFTPDQFKQLKTR
jgi:tetratricopeptide (TPR) repeat protein